ncbi:restriction endonuclease [Endozoicomonas elysicola]|uniref:Restriction endonuclease type IV Mrr domain-containing protein n=1 Tax=Endozoicomonas elysicola TaxID=305900 RepID=A0A081K9F9_9GAMM|nr:restriction endonuclease [Endozoicomonas elysicola]KEI70785.1 hypothetical protein GV64_08530 [Endozoicomonas elysicola]
MTIDFKRISDDGEDFELLIRDVLESHGVKILSSPSRGADQKKDLIVEVENKDQIGTTTSIKYLVQCKHKAHSNKSVYENELGDWRSACKKFKVDGYFLITSTIASATVQSNFDAENSDRNGFKMKVWDRQQLQSMIERSPKSVSIIKQYNLKNSINILFEQIERILCGEYHLPFKHIDTVNENHFKGLIFSKVELNNEFKTEEKRIGYFCFTDNQIQEVVTTFKLSEINIIDDEKKLPGSISLNDLYRTLQGFRDTYYQNAIWTALSCCYQNPTAVRVLETSLRNLPYQPQEVTIRNLNLTISSDLSSMDCIYISEAVKVVVNLDIQNSKNSILSQLRKADDWNLNTVETSFLSQNLVTGLIELDRDIQELKDEVFEVFSYIKDVQVKAELIEYFIALKIEDKNNVLMTFFDTHIGQRIPPRNHGVSYSPRRVVILENSDFSDFDSLKKSYIEAVQ